jgi:RNA polymerase sporulation-specific sigma factor
VTDEMLVARFQAGDARAFDRLAACYEPLLRHQARTYFLTAGDRDDLHQVALIALWKAARVFDGSGRFKPFALMVTNRHLVTALRSDRRVQNGFLNDSVREGTDAYGQRVAITELLPDERFNPVRVIEERERLATIADEMRRLPPLEHDSLLAFINGASYEEICPSLKRVDNAIQRARRKLKAA